jgi:hypothetical protein
MFLYTGGLRRDKGEGEARQYVAYRRDRAKFM